MKRLLLRAVAAVDFFVVRNVERVSHRVQWLTGRDCFDQRNDVLWLLAANQWVLLLTSPWTGVHGVFLWGLDALTLLSGGVWLLMRWAAAIHDEVDRFQRRFADQGFMNPKKVLLLYVSQRLLWLGVAIVPIPVPTVRRMAALLVLFHALDACNPLPPGTSAIRQWLRGLRGRMRVPVPTTS